jgi:DNA-binding transcriptional regulator YdaS (Cro superfamily)
MDIKTYLSQGRGRQAALAKAIGAHAPDISRWADGTRSIPVVHAAAIEAATGGLVTRQEMFPVDWQRIWPELVSGVSQCASVEKLYDSIQP